MFYTRNKSLKEKKIRIRINKSSLLICALPMICWSFTKGSLESIVEIQNVMNQFYLYSGLQFNCAKCELFSSSISRDKLLEIHYVTGFKLWTLLVRYLGVLPVTTRIIDRDCTPLEEKIIAKINHWAAKFLSYAGRFQLIQIIIYIIQNY